MNLSSMVRNLGAIFVNKMKLISHVNTNLGKYDHITDAMKRLHWLPIESRFQYKVLILVCCMCTKCFPAVSGVVCSQVMPHREKCGRVGN